MFWCVIIRLYYACTCIDHKRNFFFRKKPHPIWAPNIPKGVFVETHKCCSPGFNIWKDIPTLLSPLKYSLLNMLSWSDVTIMADLAVMALLLSESSCASCEIPLVCHTAVRLAWTSLYPQCFSDGCEETDRVHSENPGADNSGIDASVSMRNTRYTGYHSRRFPSSALPGVLGSQSLWHRCMIWEGI